MRKTLITFIALSTFACGGAAPNSSTKAPASPQPYVPPTPIPAASRPPIKTFNGRGKVTKIDLKQVSVEVDHEEIKGLMPAMVMEFFVKEKRELEALKLGDTVDFVLEDDFGQERIISIKKAK